MASQWTVLIRLWLQTLWSFRYLIAILVVVLPILGFAVGQMAAKKYESSMTILVQEAAKHNPFLEDLAVEMRLKDRIDSLDALLHSRHVLLGVAVDLEWINEDTPAHEREDMIRTLSDALKMRLVGQELVHLHYTQGTQANIDKVLLAVAQRFMEKVLAPERSSVEGSVRFLDEQIKQSAADLLGSEEALSQFMSQNADNLPDLHTGNVQRLADMKMLLSEKHTALEGAKARYDSLIARLSQSNPVVARLELNIVALSAELASLKSRYTDAHSKVQSLNRKLDSMRIERSNLLAIAPKLSRDEIEEIWTKTANDLPPNSAKATLLLSQVQELQEANAQIADLERQTATLTREVKNLDRLVVGFGDIEKELRRLEGDVQVKRYVHEKLQERAQMARVTGALGQFEAPERVKIIDQPTIPTRPSSLPAAVFAIAGLVGAIGLSAALVAFSEVTNTAFRTRASVTALTQLPVIARVPQLQDPLNALRRPKTRTRNPFFFLTRFLRRSA